MTTKKDKDPNFLTPSEILAAACKFVLEECSDEWPEDEWFELGNWDINVWTDDQTGEAFATAYPITPRGSTQTSQGITIPANFEYLVVSDDGTYTLAADTNEVLIHAGEYNGKPVDVTVERRIDGGIEAGIDYNGDAYDRIWVGE